jgi:hypothetical protein
MIRKSGSRFSEKIMRRQDLDAPLTLTIGMPDQAQEMVNFV